MSRIMSKPFKLEQTHVQQLGLLMTLMGGRDVATTKLTTEVVYGDSLERSPQGGFQLRADSTSSPTPYTTDELTQVLTGILRVRRSKPKALELFRPNNELLPGMQSYKMYRVDYTGEPTILGQGGKTNDIPDTTIAADSTLAEIEYYALNAQINFVQNLAAQNGRGVINARAEKIRARNEIMARYRDRRVWGVRGSQTPTMLNNKWMPVVVSTVELNDDMEAQALMDEVSSWIATPTELNGIEYVESPTVLLATSGLIGLLRRKIFPDAPQYSVYQAILDHTTIQEIIEVAQLEQASVGGETLDGHESALAVNPDDLEVMNVMAPTPIPGQKIGLNEDNYIIAADGGVRPTNAGAHVKILYKRKSRYAG